MRIVKNVNSTGDGSIFSQPLDYMLDYMLLCLFIQKK